MKSINLFFSRIKNESKRNLALFSLGCLVFFIALPVSCALSFSRWSRYQTFLNVNIEKKIFEYLTSMNTWMIFITVVAAFLCGITQFGYLHHKKQTDFYHSLPIDRKQIFLVKFVMGSFIYIISYLSNLMLQMIVIGIRKELSGKVLGRLLETFGLNVLGFMLLYITIIIAIMVTGQHFVSQCVTVVFLFSGPFLVWLIQRMQTRFFDTYVVASDNFFEQFVWISPLSAYITMISQFDQFTNHAWWYLGGVLLACLLLFLFARYLYQRRANEMAEKAMAFYKAHLLVKVMIVLCTSIATGLFFDSMSERTNTWLYFGALIGFVISYAIVETIHTSDFRKAFAYKGQFVGLGIIIIIFICVFRFDFIQYDDYLPSASKVKYASVYISDLDANMNDVELTDSGFMYISQQEFRLGKMKLYNIEDVVKLAQSGIERTDINSNQSHNYKNVTIKYYLKNGKTKLRSYNIALLEEKELIEAVYDTTEYKKGIFGLYEIPTDCISRIGCYRDIANMMFTLSSGQKEKLIETYLSELSSLTFEDKRTQVPIANLIVTMRYQSLERNVEYNIYPSFTNTIKLIREYGFPLDVMMNADKINYIDIAKIPMEETQMYYDKYGYTKSMMFEDLVLKTEAATQEVNRITDKDLIKKIIPFLCSGSLMSGNNSIYTTNDRYRAYVTYQTDEYNTSQLDYWFLDGQIPVEIQ